MSIVREFERAFNRQDVDGLVACCTPTGTYRDNFFGDHVGSAGLRGMFSRMYPLMLKGATGSPGNSVAIA